VIFAVGFACGLIVGVMLAWLCLTWLHPIDIEETGTSLFPINKGGK
jgi:hypothetical protein